MKLNKKLNFHLYMLVIIIFSSCVSNSNEDKTIKLQHQLDSIKIENEKLHFQDSIKNSYKETSLSLSELYRNLRKGVFMLYATDNSSISQGSAFLIDDKGCCITCLHVLKEMDDFILKDYEGNIVRKTQHKIFVNEEYDYAKFAIAPNSDYVPLNIAELRPKIGDECFAIGSPKGMEQTLSSGIVSGFRDGKLIQTTAPITHGSSGCPLFNRKGEVIGIANGGVEGGGELNFAMDISFIGSHFYPDNIELD